MDEILKKINSDILTESVVSELKEAFDSAVKSKVDEFKRAEIIAETEKILDKYDAKFEEFKAELSESKDKELDEYKSELVEALDSYLEVVVEEFLKENKIAIENEVATAKAKAILEAFDGVLVTAGVEVKQIVEAKTSKEETLTVTESDKDMEARFNKMLSENKALRTQNEKMIKMGLKAELSEGLTLVQREKFDRLADLVDMGSDKKAYLSKLEAIRESVKGEESTKEEVKPNAFDVVTESKVEKPAVTKPDSSRFF